MFNTWQRNKKVPVQVLVERGRNASSRQIPRITAKGLKGTISDIVHEDSIIYTDEFRYYHVIGTHFKCGHKVVRNYGDASTNTAESYFSLLKRGITGAFPAHF